MLRKGVWVCVGGLASALVLMQIDPRVIGLENIWIKPAKFFASIGLYFYTMDFYLRHIRLSKKQRSFSEWFLIISMGVEIVCIVGQAVRGVASHFNVASPFNGLVYTLMGIFAAAQIPFAIWLIRRVGQSTFVRDSLGTAINLGLYLFVLGCIAGAYMGGQPGHFVGVPTSPDVVPFLGWSRTVGDLRISHFIGMHGLQILPLTEWAMRSTQLKPNAKRATLVMLAAGMAAYTIATFWLATKGMPHPWM